MRHPPAARSGNVLAQLGQKHARRPRLVSGAFKAGRLQSARTLGIRRAHGTELQMTTGELIGKMLLVLKEQGEDAAFDYVRALLREEKQCPTK